MTDLTQAIEELRRVTPPNSPWEAGDIGAGSSPVDYHIATTLNAVLSGDLIPKAYAELAVALMVEKAATHVRTAEVPREETGEGAMQRALLNYAADVVSLCAPASALAELQALRDERDDAVASQFITRVERDGAEDHATETADELRQVRARAEAAEAELATLRAQVERLTGALRFYADFHENPNDGPWGINSQDFGKEARAALTEGAAP